jgi:hypothetical protein
MRGVGMEGRDMIKMQQLVLNNKLRYVGYPESLCLSCENKNEPCSFNGKRDVELCPDYKIVNGNEQKRLLV